MTKTYRFKINALSALMNAASGLLINELSVLIKAKG